MSVSFQQKGSEALKVHKCPSDVFDSLNSGDFSEEHKEKWKDQLERGKKYSSKPVPCRAMKDIIASSGVDRIDLFSLDVEVDVYLSAMG